jgi:hypothetical protein
MCLHDPGCLDYTSPVDLMTGKPYQDDPLKIETERKIWLNAAHLESMLGIKLSPQLVRDMSQVIAYHLRYPL